MADLYDQIPEETLRMTLDEQRAGARIKVLGVGGGGGNAVARMVPSQASRASRFLSPEHPRLSQRRSGGDEKAVLSGISDAAFGAASARPGLARVASC